jgi:hypothetical protein
MPFGSHTAPIWIVRLPQGTIHLPCGTIWFQYGEHGTAMAHILFSMCTFGSHLPLGSHKVHEGLPYRACGSHGSYGAPFAAPAWGTRLPYGSDVSGSMHMARIWPQFGSCRTPSTSHMAPYGYHLALQGSHKPSASCMVQTAPKWCPYRANRSHMAPSISHMAHMASIWRTAPTWHHPPPIRHGMAPIWCGTYTEHRAPIRCTRLTHGDTTTIGAPYCARCSHIVPSASQMVSSVSHMVAHGSLKPSTSYEAQLAPIWPHMA